MVITVLQYAGVVLLWVVVLGAVLITPVALPGTWIILTAGFIYALATGFQGITPGVLIALAALAGLGEVIEFFASSVAARRFGASWRGVLGTFLGAITGGVVGTTVFPVIGTVAGILIGAFTGAFAMESTRPRATEEKVRASLGAVFGSLLGWGVKTAIAISMAYLVLSRAWK